MDDVDENKEVLKEYDEVWEVLKKKLNSLMVAKKLNMWKIKKKWFEFNYDLPLNKPIKLRLLTIIIRSIFSEGSKFYPQLFLEDAFFEL